MSFKSKLFNYAINNKNLPAVTSHGSTWTYGKLLECSGSIQKELYETSRIGLYFEKSKEYILSLFAVTLSKAAFVPLEIISPKERLKYIIDDAELNIIITSNKYEQKIINKLPKNITVLFIEDLIKKNEYCITPSDEVLNESAYIIYTSGSTGNPKGVDVSFNGLTNVIEQQINITNMNKSRFYLYLAISFDASLSDIYCSLLSSSEIHIFDCLKRNAIGLKDYFNKVGITHSDLPPSLLKLLDPNDFTTLKSLIIGGEVADYTSVQNFAKSMNVVNVYGPTEATICTSMIVCDENWNKPLIGYELDNVGYRIIDDNQNEITKNLIGKIGELIITGCQLANGYINNKALNDKTFVFLDNNGVLERSYKTGDYVYYNDDGFIEFKGRIDRQIKYHGQLINLEEVESSINSIFEIKSVSVVFKNKKIYAYYEGNIDHKEIRNILKNKIPFYMIPSFILNKKIPKTVTGKNDGTLLSHQDSKNDEIEIISELFRDILNAPDLKINIDDSFINDLSGDSLDFIQLHLSLQQMGLNIQYDYLIENNSINSILNYKKNNVIINTNFLVEESKKLKLPNNIRQTIVNNKKIALITGSTGLLGSSLLVSLIEQKIYEKIYCLIRGDKLEDAETKLFKILKKNKSSHTNIIVVLGDITKNKLDMNNNDYNFLSNNVDVIYHCAANVNNILNYSQLYDSNVLSSVNIADFLFNGKDKELHYASTLSVYVSSNTLTNNIFFENQLENDGHELYSGYAQTKWLSEYYFNKINTFSKNIYIYRFGLLTPPTTNPVLIDNSFLSNCVNDLKKIKSIPLSTINLSMDITPLDIGSQAMIDISNQKNKNHIFHISSNYQLTLSKIASLLNISNSIPVIDWFNLYNQYTISQHMVDLNILYDKPHNMNIFETTYVNSFDTTNSNHIIKDFSSKSYLEKLIN